MKNALKFGTLLLLIFGVTILPIKALSFDRKVHEEECKARLKVPVKEGGLAGLTRDEVTELQNLIDGTASQNGPTYHRNDGSHDVGAIDRELKRRGWSPEKRAAARNAVRLHNVLDVTSPGTKVGKTVVNGHIVTQEMVDEAHETLARAKAGKPVRYPGWASKPGPNMAPKDRRIYNKIVNYLKNTKAGKKLAPILQRTSKIASKAAKPVQIGIVVYEGGKVVKDAYVDGEVKTDRLIESGGGMAGGWAAAWGGAQLGALACSWTIHPLIIAA